MNLRYGNNLDVTDSEVMSEVVSILKIQHVRMPVDLDRNLGTMATWQYSIGSDIEIISILKIQHVRMPVDLDRNLGTTHNMAVFHWK